MNSTNKVRHKDCSGPHLLHRLEVCGTSAALVRLETSKALLHCQKEHKAVATLMDISSTLTKHQVDTSDFINQENSCYWLSTPLVLMMFPGILAHCVIQLLQKQDYGLLHMAYTIQPLLYCYNSVITALYMLPFTPIPFTDEGFCTCVKVFEMPDEVSLAG